MFFSCARCEGRWSAVKALQRSCGEDYLPPNSRRGALSLRRKHASADTHGRSIAAFLFVTCWNSFSFLSQQHLGCTSWYLKKATQHPELCCQSESVFGQDFLFSKVSMFPLIKGTKHNSDKTMKTHVICSRLDAERWLALMHPLLMGRRQPWFRLAVTGRDG